MSFTDVSELLDAFQGYHVIVLEFHVIWIEKFDGKPRMFFIYQFIKRGLSSKRADLLRNHFRH